jgi:hypothetical protein
MQIKIFLHSKYMDWNETGMYFGFKHFTVFLNYVYKIGKMLSVILMKINCFLQIGNMIAV